MSEERDYIARYTRKDFRVDTFCSGGPGGQHQNKTQSGVRITHIPTGLVSECREQRSQMQNKSTAFRRLAEQILKWHRRAAAVERFRKSEVVRTYHEADNRVKDHLTGHQQTWDEVANDMSEMIETRVRHMADETT